MEHNPGFVTWCPGCEWNLLPAPPRKVTRLLALEHRLADGMAERLVSGVGGRRRESTRPRLLDGIIAHLLALPVHLATFGFAAGGLWLVVLGGNWPLRVLGVVLLVVAVGTRPHFSKEPKRAIRLTADSAPQLFDLLTSVASVTEAPIPGAVVINAQFNAWAQRVGWRRRRIMGIGAPLWQAAPPQARIALLGHELGHFAHGDLARGLWVGSALDTLARWRSALSNGWSTGSIQRVIGVLVFVPLRSVVAGYAALLERANAPSHRRQEHLADLDAARVGGSAGALALLDAMLAGNSVQVAITRAAARADRPDVWQTVREQIDATPLTEIERRRRAAELERSRIDDTHPRTALRIRLIQLRPALEPAVFRDPGAWARIDAEMSAGIAAAGRLATEQVSYQF